MDSYAGMGRKYTGGGNTDQSVTTKDVVVEANRAKEEAKYESQSTTVITSEDIARKQGKSVEDVIFNEIGVTRTVDAMGRVGIAIRGADARHTLIMVDGQSVLGDVSKYTGNGDELMRIGAENIDRIEIVRGAASAKYGADAIGGVVNVITKKPGKTPSVHFNAEVSNHNSRYTSSNESSALPSNFYLRADSGQIGKFNVAAWTSKRYVMPVYSSDREYTKNVNWYDNFKPSLRFYGDERNTGVVGSYAFNDDHKISFNISSDREDMERRNKNASGLGSFLEPMQIYKRNMRRDNYNFTYNGRAGKTDWQVDVSHGKTRENDTTLLSYYGNGHDDYAGKNTLYSVDWLEHERTNYNVGMNTAVNDQHYVSYGFGYTIEKATGSRLKQAPHTHTVTIDPWDYDKSLYVPDNTGGTDDTPDSHVHNYQLKKTNNGYVWDRDAEYYGQGTNGKSNTPPLKGEQLDDWNNVKIDFDGTMIGQQNFKNISALTALQSSLSLGDYASMFGLDHDSVLKKNLESGKINQSTFDKLSTYYSNYKKFKEELKKQHPDLDFHTKDEVLAYFGKEFSGKVDNGLADLSNLNQKDITYQGEGSDKGTYYGQDFADRQNQVVVGSAELKKTYAYIQDNWQVNDNTILTPSLRLDHSDLFGSKMTGNFGVTHNLNGNPHRRLKANIGTGYSEPGLGELYYDWEMYGGTGDNHLGWYWMGNPNLKPETSINFDLSVEGENNKTYGKVGIFHNEIKNYMTSYFIGQLIDFNFNGSDTYTMTPDRIYSFRNLGKAKITGIEAEVQQKFNDKWSAKLGYTWLHAENASDNDMPSRLLDRPTHKFDIGLNYDDKEAGFRGAFWGSYYVDMLDSNSVSVDQTWGKDEHGVYTKKDAKYKEKSFGVWNLLLEKDFGKDVTAYVGVDNIFNHRDDDRAYQDRVYRAGVNVKMDDLGNALFGDNKPVFKKDKDGNPIITNVYGKSWFLSRPSDNAQKAGSVDVYGDYRLRSNMFKGEDKAAMRYTKTTSADAGAVKNYADKSGHGLEQRLRLGVNYQIADDLKLDVVGSTSRHDTSYNVADKRGLHDAFLEKAELNKKANQWDWTVGRIHEPMGVTGYWFGKEYDGARVMYTNDKTQVVIGYGDFSQTTGVSDSAYSHKEAAVIERAPTLYELLGLYSGMQESGSGSFIGHVYTFANGYTFDASKQANYYRKFNEAGKNETDPVKKAEAKLAVIRELVGVLNGIDKAMTTTQLSGDALKAYRPWNQNAEGKENAASDFYTNVNGADIHIIYKNGTDGYLDNIVGSDFVNNEKYGGITGLLEEKNIRAMMGDILDAADKANGGIAEYVLHDGTRTTDRNKAIDQMFSSFVGNQATYTEGTTSNKLGDNASYNGVSKFIYNLLGKYGSYNPMNGAPVPLPGAPAAFTQAGYLLKQDKIPAMDRAAFIKVRHQIGDNIGLEAWKLNSFGEGAHISRSDVGINEDMRIADVIGVGAKVRLGDRSMFSIDYGQNRSAMGKYFHGHNIYGTGDKKYDLLGFADGSTPDFWVARLDYGIADTNAPGSWNAYVDYKAFDHGSFLGGTGADLPDRYLDGIRSFTAGFGYVPARNLLFEASYTFDAHSTQKRDTLYTPEDFSLGDYTRVSLTYKF